MIQEEIRTEDGMSTQIQMKETYGPFISTLEVEVVDPSRFQERILQVLVIREEACSMAAQIQRKMRS